MRNLPVEQVQAVSGKISGIVWENSTNNDVASLSFITTEVDFYYLAAFTESLENQTFNFLLHYPVSY